MKSKQPKESRTFAQVEAEYRALINAIKEADLPTTTKDVIADCNFPPFFLSNELLQTAFDLWKEADQNGEDPGSDTLLNYFASLFSGIAGAVAIFCVPFVALLEGVVAVPGYGFAKFKAWLNQRSNERMEKALVRKGELEKELNLMVQERSLSAKQK